MVAHNRCGAHTVPNHDGRENKCQIHDDAVGRHAVLADIFHQLIVIEHGNHGGGNVGEEFAQPVEAGLAQGRKVECGSYKAQPRTVRERKIDERDETASHLRGSRGPCRTLESQPEDTDQQQVEQHVQTAGDERYRKTEPRPLCRDHQCLEHDLQDEEGQGNKENVPVHHAVADHGFVRSQKTGDVV